MVAPNRAANVFFCCEITKKSLKLTRTAEIYLYGSYVHGTVTKEQLNFTNYT